jgi:hypothetical protein
VRRCTKVLGAELPLLGLLCLFMVVLAPRVLALLALWSRIGGVTAVRLLDKSCSAAMACAWLRTSVLSVVTEVSVVRPEPAETETLGLELDPGPESG